jgi:hypothetical protein
MKNKSFLFLIAALAIGLAFAGCDNGDDGGGTGTDYYWGFSSDVDDINAAFTAGAATVYLTKDVSFSNANEVLLIPSGKTLDLKGYALTDSAKGYLVVEGTLKWDADNTSPVTLGQSYIIAGKNYINTNVGTLSDTSTKDRPIIVYGGSTAAGGSAVVAGGTIEVGAALFALTAAELTDPSKPGNLGALAKPGFILGNFTPPAAIAYTGDGIGLIVTGNLTLTNAGTIGGGGTVTVIGKLTNNIGSVSANGNPVVAGTLNAAYIESTGFGAFNILRLTSPVEQSTFNGNADIGTFSAKGPVTFNEEVAGTIIADNVTFNGKVNAYPTSKAVKVTFGNGATIVTGGLEGTTAVLKGALNIGSATTGGTLTVSKLLALGSGQSIVLNASGGLALVSTGELISDNYTLSGAGSILNNATTAGGTAVTLAASGITNSNAAGNTSTPTILFGNQILLGFTNSAIIDDIILDVTSGGTVGIAAGSMLTIKDKGSISVNTSGSGVAYANTGSLAIIIADTTSGGSLVAGTAHADSALAGSVGTATVSQITNGSGIGFVIVGTSSTGTLPSVTLGADIKKVDGGSIAVFNVMQNNTFPIPD